MRIGAEFTYCSLDDKPTTNSRIYKALRRFFGKRFADQFTYKYAVEPDDA